MRLTMAIKRSVILVISLAVYGCDSGGSSGESNNTIVAPLETGTTIALDTSPLVIEQPGLQWNRCATDSRLECATLRVPMDYTNPQGRTINIELARANDNRATSERTLLINPGGPGAGGIDFLESLVSFGDIPDSISNMFDFVSFDPRGIGRSTPVECDLDAFIDLDGYPTTRADIQRNLNLTSTFAQNCFESEGEYVQHLGSYNVVRDMNEMRKALGLTQIDFLGYSYGTRLAALYLQTYPQNSGRFILDGAMTPDPAVVPLVKGGLLPAQSNISTLADACVGRTTVCDPQEFLVQLQTKIDDIGQGPDTLESGLLFLILQFASTNPGFEQVMIGRLANYLDTGDVDELEFIFDFLALEESLQTEIAFSVTTYVGVLCSDDPARPTIESVLALREAFNADSDLFAEAYYDTAAICAGWPTSLDPIPRIATNQAPPSLVIGGPTDAQTPLVFAQEMAAALGGQFLRSEHDGHTTVFNGMDRCTESAVEVFLTTGVLPSSSQCGVAASVSLAARWHEPTTRIPR